MKTQTLVSIGLLALLAVGIGPRAKANLFSDNFEALIIAERAKGAPAEPASPVAYVAFDGGYVEAGNPIAGDDAPSADAVRQDIDNAFASQGFRLGDPAPAALVTYYWGVIRPDREQINTPYGIKTNLRARIRLVSTEEQGSEAENVILRAKKGPGQDMNASSIASGATITVIQEARLPRIFVVVSAYDYAAVAQGQDRLLWRVKASAQESAGDMEQVIPALIAQSAPFFGKQFNSPKFVHATLASSSGASATASAPTAAEPAGINKQFVDDLLRRDRRDLLGEGESNY